LFQERLFLLVRQELEKPHHRLCRRSRALTWWNIYFHLLPGMIRSPQILEFLSNQLRQIPGKVLIVWDGLPGHHRRTLWDYVRQQRGRL
jgi:hypothetical protein